MQKNSCTNVSKQNILLLGTPDEQKSDKQQIHELMQLVNVIPGGVCRCRDDEGFTFLAVSEGFLSMTGYTRQELSEQFQCSYIQLIHPDDRQFVVRTIKGQLNQNKTSIEVEYRIRCKDGSIKWILERGQLESDENEGSIFYSVTTDVTNLRDIRENLRLSLERQQIIMNQITDVVFEWDIQDDRLTYSSNVSEKFGFVNMTSREGVYKKILSYIHPEDEAAFAKMVDTLRKGGQCFALECRIRDKNERFAWCRIKVMSQCDAMGNPKKAIGIISDIDDERQMLDRLREKAERDALTGLYDKSAVRSLTEKYLDSCPPNQMNALLMLDVDNFKIINDSNGHLFGDTVLSDVAALLKREFRTDDLIGRIGGDEFAIFMKNVPTKQFIQKKAEQIVASVSEMYADKKKKISISCSIGSADMPGCGRTFQELYKCADTALYCAKSLGKNCCVAYVPHMGLPIYHEMHTHAGTENDSQIPMLKTVDSLSEYIFHTLNSTENLDEAIPLVLEIIGKQFDVSRAYIFENAEDGTHCRNIFEWCNEGVQPEMEHLQDVPNLKLEDYALKFNESGIFYCENVDSLPAEQSDFLKRQGIFSILQCALRQNGRFCGYVGFDECTGMRLWKREDVSALVCLAEMLGMFLLKKRALERERQNEQKMKVLLDRPDTYLYVVDKETYELLYLNGKLRVLAPEACQGDICYKTFFNRDIPCEKCPVRGLEKGNTGPLTMFNPQYQVWTSIVAEPFPWDERDACILSCYDITKFMEIKNKKPLT